MNVFVRLCRVEGAPDGTLAGRRIGIKDNLAVAGIPVTNASRTLSYTPTVDAVVVERILDAGGTIVGKLNLDDFSASGYGDTSVFGATRNPHAPAHAAGGSSSGAGAAVASGLVDLAVGVDQGGSVRTPAAACGVVGLKATTGLVPSFGLSYIDHCFDCVGPIGRTVADVATLLGVIAGADWRDPQWVRDLTLDDYAAGLEDGVDGLRVAVLDESHGDDALLCGGRARGCGCGVAGGRRDRRPRLHPALAVRLPHLARDADPRLAADAPLERHLRRAPATSTSSEYTPRGWCAAPSRTLLPFHRQARAARELIPP